LPARRHLALWTRVAAVRAQDEPPLGSRAQLVADYLAANGASFFDELLGGAHLLRTELEDALAELVARGRVHCDSFVGLRALLVPSAKRTSAFAGRGRRTVLPALEDAGRWTLTRRADATPVSPPAQSRSPGVGEEAAEHIARTLLRRYGVIGWRMMEREAAWLPPWRELLRVYHRLEARGEIRGGRFIAGMSGEQFALPEAIGALRQVRRRAHDGTLLGLSGVDPLNLLGTVLPGAKLPRVLGTRFVLRDGLPLATLVAGKMEFVATLSPQEQRATRKVLLREREGVLPLASPMRDIDSHPAAPLGL
ncbi:MAG: ATP-dependent DNA helicase, partial [Pseudomonadota bacterium]|nr:ATP-dependent DNA helicase [Pseudomonadota bacterium]